MGGGGGRSLSKLTVALTVIFVILLLALFAQFFYTFWRRRVFRRQTSTGSGVDSIISSSESIFSSKELLYFFCVRPHSDSMRVTSSNNDLESNRQLDMEVVDIDLLKLEGMFGPPRFLFTIKEEEREGFDSPADKSQSQSPYSTDKQAKIEYFNRSKRLSLEECFKATEDSVVKLQIDDIGECDATPFSTPNASPIYFTPSPSPVHNVVNALITEEIRICSDSKKTPPLPGR